MMSETVVTIDPNRGAAAGVGPPPQPKPAATGGALGWIKFNYQYFAFTIPGYLKIAQLILGIICMALASPALVGATHWFLFVAVTSFIATLLWTFVYLLGIREVLNLAVNWILTELLNTAIAALLYFIAFIVQLAVWSNINSIWYRGANIAAGVFGIFNFLAYVGSAYFLYLEHRSGAPA